MTQREYPIDLLFFTIIYFCEWKEFLLVQGPVLLFHQVFCAINLVLRRPTSNA